MASKTLKFLPANLRSPGVLVCRDNVIRQKYVCPMVEPEITRLNMASFLNQDSMAWHSNPFSDGMGTRPEPHSCDKVAADWPFVHGCAKQLNGSWRCETDPIAELVWNAPAEDCDLPKAWHCNLHFSHLPSDAAQGRD